MRKTKAVVEAAFLSANAIMNDDWEEAPSLGVL
jgi:hypothetical protein